MLSVPTTKTNKITKGHKELTEMMNSQVYAYVQPHPIVYIKYVQFSVYQLYLNKSSFKTEIINIYCWLNPLSLVVICYETINNTI